jgi:hypothetical protein
MTIQEEIIKTIEQQVQIRDARGTLNNEFAKGCELCRNIINRVFSENDNRPPAVTVKEAIERKIINSPFALKGSHSGKMYFYSWKKSISKMPENIANLKLSTNYDFEKGKELGSYHIEPMVRLVESIYNNRPFLEPYVLVWVSDYELSKKGE